MNIVEYKEAFHEVSVNTQEIGEKILDELNKKNAAKLYKRKMPVFIYTLTILLFISFTLTRNTYEGTLPNLTITVYASDLMEEVLVTDTPILIASSNQLEMMHYDGLVTGGVSGYALYKLDIRCEGENISTVEYRVSEELITRDNLYQAEIWFAEQLEYAHSTDKSIVFDESTYIVMRDDWFESPYRVMRVLGSSYIVDYDNQNNQNLSISLKAVRNAHEELVDNEFIMTVIVTLNDGSQFEKFLLLRQGDVHNEFDDSISQLEIELYE